MRLLEMSVVVTVAAGLAVAAQQRWSSAAETARARAELERAEAIAARYRWDEDCEGDLPASVTLEDALVHLGEPDVNWSVDWEARYSAGMVTLSRDATDAFRRLSGGAAVGDRIEFRARSASRARQRGRRYFGDHVQGQETC